MQVIDVVVGIAFVFDRDSAVAVIGEIQSISTSGGLRDKLGTIPGVGSFHTVHGFGQPCPVAAVNIVYTRRIVL